MTQNEPKNEKEKWTLKRIAALIGIFLLLAMYALTMIFALMDSPAAKGLLMAAIFCTIAVPVLLYAMILVTGNLRRKGKEMRDKAAQDETSHKETISESSSENTEDNISR